jgi:outer membrane lipoprotein-sorting protein
MLLRFSWRWVSICLSAMWMGTFSPAIAAPANIDLPTLAALLAQRKSAEARFTEERFVSGFEGPLRASGTLSFTAPDRFSRQTLEPQAESMSVEGNIVSLKRGKRSRQMALDAVPELTALVEAMRGTLNGDVATLQKHFNTRVEGQNNLWILTLTPLDIRLAAQVRELKIAGVGSDLRSVELWLSGGDRSIMMITPATITPPMPITTK